MREWKVYFEYMDRYEDIYGNDEVHNKRKDLRPDALRVTAPNETAALILAKKLLVLKRPSGWRIFSNRVKVKLVSQK